MMRFHFCKFQVKCLNYGYWLPGIYIRFLPTSPRASQLSWVSSFRLSPYFLSSPDFTIASLACTRHFTKASQWQSYRALLITYRQALLSLPAPRLSTSRLRKADAACSHERAFGFDGPGSPPFHAEVMASMEDICRYYDHAVARHTDITATYRRWRIALSCHILVL